MFLPIVGPTCGSTFDNFHQIWYSGTDSYVKLVARHICVLDWYPQTPLKVLKMQFYLSYLHSNYVFANRRTHMWVNLWQFSPNLIFWDWFLCKIGCLTYRKTSNKARPQIKPKLLKTTSFCKCLLHKNYKNQHFYCKKA